MASNTQNPPGARRTIQSMRFLGYDNRVAIADIVDNAIDADATEIHISVRTVKGDVEITIADNGIGMDRATLDEALRLGSETERHPDSDLGLYGMGLVTASLSICRRLEVLTRSAGGPLLKSYQDVKEIIEQNAFVKYLGETDEADARRFERLLMGAESGTIVILTDCDRLSNRNTTVFANGLRKYLGQTFRLFLSEGKNGRSLTVNGDPVQPLDPLVLGNPNTELYSDETYPVKYKDADGNEHVDEIRIRIAVLPDFGQEGNADREINLRNQGFYVLRNNREIAAGKTLDVFVKHPQLNRVRAELYFSGSMDAAMGVNFIKQGLNPNQAIVDKLNQAARMQVYSIKNRLGRASNKAADSTVSHEEAARRINQKSALLMKPKVRKEQRTSSNGEGSGNGVLPKNTGTSRQNFQKSKLVDGDLTCRFTTASNGPGGTIYEAWLEGRVVVIEWNIDHPFYHRFVLENRDNPGVANAADYLVFSLACAELIHLNNDENIELMLNLRSVLSTNMRTLLS